MKTVSAIKFLSALAMSMVMGFAMVSCDDEEEATNPLENEFDRVVCTIDVIPANDMRTFADMTNSSYTDFTGEEFPLGIAHAEKETVSFHSMENQFPKTASVKIVATPKPDVEMQEGETYYLGHNIKVTATIYSKANTTMGVASKDVFREVGVDAETGYVENLNNLYPLNINISVNKSDDRYILEVR